MEDISAVRAKEHESGAVKKVNKKEPSIEDIESAKKIFGKVLRGPETSEQFGGSKVFLFEGHDGKKRYYALRRNSGGQLEGNEFSLMEKEDGQWKNFVSTGLHRLDQHDPNVSVGPTYQMHGPQLEKMEALLKSHNIEI